MAQEGDCEICSVKAAQKCAGCQEVYYCSRDHQKQHWKSHKFQCAPVTIKHHPDLGRYLEATRDVAAGDIIMKEKPLLSGPAQSTAPICLGCYKLLEKETSVPCAKCGWPMCSEECSHNENHTPECYYTQNRGQKVSITTFGETHPNYQCITVLRCLYQRDFNNKLWSKLQMMQSHCEDRKGTFRWENDLKMICNFIWSFFKLKDTFSEDEIMKCCGIIQINCHEVPLTEPGYIAIFDRVSMIEHSCRANCYKTFTSNGEVLIVPAVPIQKGSHLSICYCDPLWGTEVRRYFLADTKFFECECERCSDVTECGTMYSAVKCKKQNCKGYLLPTTFILPLLQKIKLPDQAPVDDKVWICNICKDEVKDGIIQKLLQDIAMEFTAMPKGDVDACERFIEHCGSYLHPNHFHMSDVTLALSQTIGHEQELGIAGVSDDRLLLKSQLCKKFHDLVETLTPADARLRGTLLFELHAAIIETGRRMSLTDGPNVMLGHYQEARKVLVESLKLLRHEPAELPEGMLAKQGRINLMKIDELTKQISAILPSPL